MWFSIYSEISLIRFSWEPKNKAHYAKSNYPKRLKTGGKYAYSVNNKLLLSNVEVAGQFVGHFVLINDQDYILRQRKKAASGIFRFAGRCFVRQFVSRLKSATPAAEGLEVFSLQEERWYASFFAYNWPLTVDSWRSNFLEACKQDAFRCDYDMFRKMARCIAWRIIIIGRSGHAWQRCFHRKAGTAAISAAPQRTNRSFLESGLSWYSEE